MKEITRIHLAATPYNIEIAAKKELEKYLAAVEQVLGADTDTLREIEARMVELLMEKGVIGDKVITDEDVAMLKDRLGKPGDFVENADSAVRGEPKRFMRDDQRGMIGGVLSGLAAYTNTDVVWWRIAAVFLLLVSFGTVVLVYVVLWLAVPPARTAAERLQMRGRTASLENIQSEVQEYEPYVPAQRKPLLIILRAVGVLTLIGMAVGALGLVAVAVWGGAAILGVSVISNAWLVAGLILCAVSGVLFAVLMGMGTYMLVAWQASRRMLWMLLAVIVAGLISFGSGLGLGMYGGMQSQATIEQHTHKKTVRLQDKFNGVDSLEIVGDKKEGAVPYEYHVTNDTPRAEVTVVQFDKTNGETLPLEVTRHETTLKITSHFPMPSASTMGGCLRWTEECRMQYSKVDIYGPALNNITAKNAHIVYRAVSQPALVASVTEGNLELLGSVDKLEVRDGKQGSVYAQDAAISQVAVATTSISQLNLGVIKNLQVNAAEVCGGYASPEITYASTESLEVNSKMLNPTQAHQLGCVEIAPGGN